MKCQKCGVGEIRVYVAFACACGHHSLICDGCYATFKVPCGEPYDASALPPDHLMEEDDSLRRGHDEFNEMQDDDALKTTYEDMVREALATSPDLFPLLDDFKKTLDG